MALYALPWSKRISELQQAFYTLCGVKTDPPKLYQCPIHALPLSKRTLQIFHKPTTCFMEVKTDSQNFPLRWSNWTPRSSTSSATRFSVVKKKVFVRSSRSLLYDSLCSIWTVGNSTTLGVVSACTSVAGPVFICMIANMCQNPEELACGLGGSAISLCLEQQESLITG